MKLDTRVTDPYGCSLVLTLFTGFIVGIFSFAVLMLLVMETDVFSICMIPLLACIYAISGALISKLELEPRWEFCLVFAVPLMMLSVGMSTNSDSGGVLAFVWLYLTAALVFGAVVQRPEN